MGTQGAWVVCMAGSGVCFQSHPAPELLGSGVSAHVLTSHSYCSSTGAVRALLDLALVHVLIVLLLIPAAGCAPSVMHGEHLAEHCLGE